MRRFLNGTQEAWDDLSHRASRACVVFTDCQLPPGCQPTTARIGFEIQPTEAIVFIDKGIRYHGSSRALSAWLRQGEIRFHGIDDLKNWLQHEIGPLFQVDTESAGRRSSVSSRMPSDLTDLDAVTGTAAAHAAAVIDVGDLLRELRSRVFGQDNALEAIARRVTQHVRRANPRRPATMFALGPTGVGKTSAAVALAESLGSLLGGRWSSFIRLNMNEYQERHRVSQLLGAPPSYIGYGDGTQLIDRLAARPESVVLFDEIEKAHPDILVTLMSAMDTGELSSPGPAAHGRVIDCRRAVFFFTSNIDMTDAIAELAADWTAGPVAAICRRHLAAGIRPELVGRISAFLIFHPLSVRSRAEIATAAVVKTAAEYGLQVIRVAPEIISSIVSQPYDNLGARPDEYYIDEFLGPEFSRYITSGGQPTVKIVANPAPICIPADHEQTVPGNLSHIPLDTGIVPPRWSRA
jgi:AAA domain (Cdc48 subfamily)